MSLSQRASINSFTLVELLIVIAILAVLAAAVVVVINPAELLAQARDSQRTADMKALNDVINLLIVDSPSTTLGTFQKVYVSIPDTSATCANITSLPSLPAGWTYNCVTDSNLKKIDGTGWIPIDLSAIKGGSPVPSLPIDPMNDASSLKYYSFTVDNAGVKYKVQAPIESIRHAANAGNDGGIDPSSIEIGTILANAPFISGIVGLWKFEEGAGASVIDYSGFGNNLSWTGTGTHYLSGKVGYSGQFNGTDDYAQGALTAYSQFTVTAIIKPNLLGREQHVGDYTATQFYFGSSNKLGTASWSTAAGNTLMTTGTWYHIAIVRDSRGVQLYLNGQKDGNLGSLGSSPSTPFVIGDLPGHGGSYKFNGLIDEVTVYRRALSPGEVLASYLATK
ncbi:MAG: LamG domain-containing protein [Candidatus Colwellbacteria bacterium]|nr:LamG domain-containing protein [Candidatus Colwellbacteria bacterium]